MNRTNSDFKLVELLERLAQSNSKLAVRWREDAAFRCDVKKMIEALENFYRQKDANALRTFKSKLYEWIKNPRDDYIGFVGELFIADRLRRQSILHHFIPKAESPIPDIELRIIDCTVYFEVKTLQEDRYALFCESVEKQVKEIPSGCRVILYPLYVGGGKEGALVARAVKALRVALFTGDYSPITYEGEEGEYHIEFEPGAISDNQLTEVIPWRPRWPGSRMPGHDIPFLEYKLKETLKQSIEQFAVYKPTFLVWCNFDLSKFAEDPGREPGGECLKLS